MSVETIRLRLKKPQLWHDIVEELGEEDAHLPPIRTRREEIIEELVEILAPSRNIQHKKRLVANLIDRERKASTAIGHGIAVPHVRTKHIRDLTIGFARTDFPIDWDAPDGLPVDIFFVMIAPPFDDRIYKKIWSKLAGILRLEIVREQLRNAIEAGEIIRILRKME